MPDPSVRIRIVGRDLPGRKCLQYDDVRVALQVGKDNTDLVAGSAPVAEWTTVATVGRSRDGHPSVRGPAIHGNTGEKFLYLAWIARGANGRDAMFRRAKLQLDAVSAAQLEQAALPGKTLLAELSLTDACGAPLCASVRPPLIRWSVR